MLCQGHTIHKGQSLLRREGSASFVPRCPGPRGTTGSASLTPVHMGRWQEEIRVRRAEQFSGLQRIRALGGRDFGVPSPHSAPHFALLLNGLSKGTMGPAIIKGRHPGKVLSWVQALGEGFLNANYEFTDLRNYRITPC